MKTPILTAVLAALLWAAPAAAQGPAQSSNPQFSSPPAEDGPSATADDGRGTPFVVNKSDSICGIDEPRAITKPAKVDYDALLASTSEASLPRRRMLPARLVIAVFLLPSRK